MIVCSADAAPSSPELVTAVTTYVCAVCVYAVMGWMVGRGVGVEKEAPTYSPEVRYRR